MMNSWQIQEISGETDADFLTTLNKFDSSDWSIESVCRVYQCKLHRESGRRRAGGKKLIRKPYPTQEELRLLFDYCDGQLIRKTVGSNGKRRSCGTCDTPEQAHQAYLEATCQA